MTMREPSGLNAAEPTESGVAPEREDLGAAPRVPDLRRAVEAPGDDARAVGAERRRARRSPVCPEREDLGAAPGVPDLRRLVLARGDDARAVGAERRRADGIGVPLERHQVGMAEAMDITPLPAAEVGPGAVEQGQRGGDVVLPPLLVGHLDRSPVLDALDLLTLPLHLSPGRRLAVTSFLRESPRFRFPVAGPLCLLPGHDRFSPEVNDDAPEPRQDQHRRGQDVGRRQRRPPPHEQPRPLQDPHGPRRDRPAIEPGRQVVGHRLALAYRRRGSF